MGSGVRAYRFPTGNGRWPWMSAVTGAMFLLGGWVVGIVWPSRALLLGSLSALVGVLVIVAATVKLHFGPVIWYTIQESETVMVLTSEAGEIVEVRDPKKHSVSVWWGRLAPLFFAIASALQLALHHTEWPLFGAIAVIGAADAWLYPTNRRPIGTLRVRLNGRPRRLFLVPP